MAKANAFNRSLTGNTGFPLSAVTGNLSATRLNSGTDREGALWNGAGVWVRPLTGNSSVSYNPQTGLARYFSSAPVLTNLGPATSPVVVTAGTLASTTNTGTTNGGILTGETASNTLVRATLSASGQAGLTVTNGSNSIVIDGTGDSTTVTTTTSATMASNAAGTHYISNNAARVSFALPGGATLGTILTISGLGAGGWRITQGAGQSIRVGSSVSTTGAGGYVESTGQYDSVEIVCIVTSTTWAVVGKPQSSGLTVV